MSESRTINHKFFRWLTAAENFERKWRKDNQRNFQYYDGKQWTDEELEVFEKRGQQPTVLNVIRPTIDMVLALENDKRADLQICGRNADDDRVADLLTELLKQVFDASDADYFTSAAFREGIVGGRGWLFVDIDPEEDTDQTDAADREPRQILFKWVPWEEVYIDPYHRRPDGTDARFIIRKQWMDRDEVKERWPDQVEKIDTAFNEQYLGVEYAAQRDAPDRATENFYDPHSGRVCLCHCWYRNAKGQLRYVIFADEIFLYGDPEDESKNEPPSEINSFPLIPFYAFRTCEGVPQGLVTYLRDAQDQINKLNSKYLWNLSSNRMIYEDGALAPGVSPEEMAAEYQRPNGIVRLAENGLNKIRTEDKLKESSFLSNQLQFLLTMIQRISGVNDSMLGYGGTNERSATQQQNRILQGASMQTQILENLHFAKKQAAQVVLELIGKHYTQGIIIRITMPNHTFQYQALNQPVVNEAGAPLTNADGTPQIHNRIGDIMRFDVVFRAVPPFSTVRERTLEVFSEVAKSGVLPPQIVSYVMLELSDIPHKRELMAQAQAYYQQQQQQAQAQAQQQQQLTQAQTEQAQAQTQAVSAPAGGQ